MSSTLLRSPRERKALAAEPITDWQVLRFRTQAEIAAFQSQRGQWLLEDAAAPLRDAHVPVCTRYREGDVAFEILDTAEQTGRNEIVFPPPHPRWLSLFGGDVVRQVIRRAAASRVVIVDRNGVPLGNGGFSADETAYVPAGSIQAVRDR